MQATPGKGALALNNSLNHIHDRQAEDTRSNIFPQSLPGAPRISEPNRPIDAALDRLAEQVSTTPNVADTNSQNRASCCSAEQKTTKQPGSQSSCCGGTKPQTHNGNSEPGAALDAAVSRPSISLAPQLGEQTTTTSVATVANSRNHASCCSVEEKPSKLSVNQSSCCGGTKSQTNNGNSEPTTVEQISGNTILDGTVSYPSILPTPQLFPYQNFNYAEQGFFDPRLILHPAPAQAPPPFYMNNGFLPSSASQTTLINPPSNGQSSNLKVNQSSLQSSLANVHPPSGYSHAPAFVGGCDICSCGDGCQCLGCASHPYNDKTMQYVQEMGAMMAFDQNYGNGGSPATYQNQNSTSLSGDPRDTATTTSSSIDFSIPTTLPENETGTATRTGTGRDDLKPTPTTYPAGNVSNAFNDEISPFSPEYTTIPPMESTEYYTLEYPIGLPSTCSDVTGSCQCGNDCCCAGCLTHNGHNGQSATTGDASLDSIESDRIYSPL